MSNWEFVGDCTFICKDCGEVLSQAELIEISGSEDEYWDAKCPKCEKARIISNMKYYVCCPMCDKEKCVRGTEECDAEKWEKEREGEAE